MKGLIASTVAPALYLIASVLFILGLKGLTRVRTARAGNRQSALAMLIAVVATLLHLGFVSYTWILIGLVVGTAIGAYAAVKVEMTEMPEMVALFNGCGGLSSALVALAMVWLHAIQPAGAATLDVVMKEGGVASAITTSLSILIGGLTFSGSIVAYLKLRGTVQGNTLLPGRHVLNGALILGALAVGVWMAVIAKSPDAFMMSALLLTGLALVLGILLVVPIGGADMPVVISLLNSYSGLAASATGFVLESKVLIISGALVGASGLILTNIMCVAMNRSLLNVLVGGFGQEAGGSTGSSEYTNVRSTAPEEVAMMMEDATSVVIVPGYGLAVAQAQHAVREMASLLEARGCTVRFAIHPVAGRMPGHMNVLLAEADVPYEQLVEMDEINPDFKNTDLTLIVGANDVVNPAALNEKSSPIYGMPILEVHHSRMVIVVKRSLSPGYAGIKNELFDHDNTLMLFGDGKKAISKIVSELKENA